MNRLFFILLLCLLPCNLIMRTQNVVYAAVDEDDTEDAVVEDVDEDDEDDEEVVTSGGDDEDDEDDEDEDGVGASEFVDVKLIFPEHAGLEFPAGSVVTALVGFHNKGQNAFTVQNIESSLRHLQEFSYHIQNFTNLAVNQEVKSHEHATFLYTFKPHESFDPRDFGFVFNVHYIDNNEAPYVHTAFNGTIHIVESEEGLDTGALIAYAGTIAVGVLGLLVFKPKSAPAAKASGSKKQKAVETGTSSKSDVDSDWLADANIPSPRKHTKSH